MVSVTVIITEDTGAGAGRIGGTEARIVTVGIDSVARNVVKRIVLEIVANVGRIEVSTSIVVVAVAGTVAARDKDLFSISRCFRDLFLSPQRNIVWGLDGL